MHEILFDNYQIFQPGYLAKANNRINLNEYKTITVRNKASATVCCEAAVIYCYCDHITFLTDTLYYITFLKYYHSSFGVFSNVIMKNIK